MLNYFFQKSISSLKSLIKNTSMFRFERFGYADF